MYFVKRKNKYGDYLYVTFGSEKEYNVTIETLLDLKESKIKPDLELFDDIKAIDKLVDTIKSKKYTSENGEVSTIIPADLLSCLLCLSIDLSAIILYGNYLK